LRFKAPDLVRQPEDRKLICVGEAMVQVELARQ
jgi:hypothetical protein